MGEQLIFKKKKNSPKIRLDHLGCWKMLSLFSLKADVSIGVFKEVQRTQQRGLQAISMPIFVSF